MRRRIAAGDVPEYLLLSIAATAARFSSHEYFEGRQLDAADAMARAAWAVILHQVFATDSTPEVATAQAIGMLAVIDFTGQLIAETHAILFISSFCHTIYFG